MAPALKAAADTATADAKSVQVMDDIRSHRSTTGTSAHQNGEDELAVVAPGLGSIGSAAVADAVAVANPAQADVDGMAKRKGMIMILRGENLTWHGELIAE